MMCNYNFRLNGVPITRFIVRRNKITKGWPTQEESLVVVDPTLGEITIDDRFETDIYGDPCPSFILEMRPKNLSATDKSWLINAGWRRTTVRDTIALLIKLSEKKPVRDKV